MEIVDRAAAWDPVPQRRPARVWLPPRGTAASARPHERPRTGPLVLAPAPDQARNLPRCLRGLLAAADVRPGDAVVVDLGDAATVHLTGLGLLLSALWRRVGPHGRVTLRGGTPALRSQVARLDLGPEGCRADVYGQAAPAPAPEPTPGRLHLPHPRPSADGDAALSRTVHAAVRGPRVLS